MPDISISDSSSLSVAASLLDTSVIGKTPSAVMHFAQADVVGAMNQPLDKVQINSTSLAFNYRPSITLPGGTAKLKAGGDLGGEVDLYRPKADGKPVVLFDADQFGTALDTGKDCYLALLFDVGVGAEGGAKPGNFALELEGSATGSAKLYWPFSAEAGAFPTLKQGVEELLSSYFLPTSIDDAAKLKPGAGIVFEAKGAVHFEAAFDVLATVNPTATPGICTSYGPIAITAGPAITLGGKFSLSGDLQVRIWRKSDSILQLGYYRRRAGIVALTFDASAGFDVAVGKFDVLAKVYGLLGDTGKLDAAWLKANVPESVAEQVQQAYEAAVQTTLSVAVDGEVDASTTDQAAFVWNFDLSKLDAASRDAFRNALDGDISALVNGAHLPPAVTLVGSVLDRVKDKKHCLTLNFLGVLDHASVQEFVSRSNAKVSEDGQLVLTDTEHLTRLDALTTPLVKSDRLRSVFTEDCVATVGYAASLGPISPQLKVAYSYFVYKDHLPVTDLGSYIAIATDLGVSQAAADWSGILQSASGDRPGHFLGALTYDSQTAANLFVDAQGVPRKIEDFEKVGRAATAATPGAIFSDRFRALLADDNAWKLMRDAGTSQHFNQIVGVDLIDPPDWAKTGFVFTLHIVNWAAAMNAAAEALQSVHSYSAAHPGDDLLHDTEFVRRRQAFASKLQKAIGENSLFNDAQGILTMSFGAKPAGKKVTIRYGATLKEYA